MADKLKTALKSHRKKDLRSDTFGRLWGAFGPHESWPESTLDMYLALFGEGTTECSTTFLSCLALLCFAFIAFPSETHT